MTYAKNILKKCHTIVAVLLLFIIASVITNSLSFASDEANNNEQPSPKSAKYSKFFDAKTHWCDALVITCSDFRFTSATQELINNRLGLKGNYDYISIPGSIRNLLDSNTRDLVLKTFGVSFRLHHVKRVIIFGHQDCGIGYGGSKNFPDPAAEFETICKDLKKARRLMGFRFPHLKIYLYYGTVLFDDHQRIYNFKQIF